ncbi:unnamed protein product, partial [Dicrocoelium dendriticum]
ADDKTLIDASVSNCSKSPCVVDGGAQVDLEIIFKARRTVRSGKAQVCSTDSKSKMCSRPAAEIEDICEYIEGGCPLEEGSVHTYKRTYFTPDASLQGEVTYKLYDEECNVIACMQYRRKILSKNKKMPQNLLTDDSYPCGGK